jgi:outer membrane receptor protein involved in Fe transport
MFCQQLHKSPVLTFYLLFFISVSGFTQRVAITGKVSDKESGEPLFGASIILHRPNDSLLSTGTVADTNGVFELKSVPNGTYVLEVSFMGFYPQEKNISVTGENRNLGTFLLEPSEILLDEVTVTSRKTALVYDLDKQVYNVEKDIMAESGSVSEILQNIPSVSVDIDGNINLRNSGNITFFVNGRPSAMLRRDAASVLEQMPANTIERIEIITNPSARYRPDGVGGIINLVMKKETREGLKGQFTLNAGTEQRYNGNVTLNYGAGDFKLFGNYGLRHAAGTRLFTDDRIYKYPESKFVKSHYNETGSSATDALSHTLYAGGSYDINDFNTLELSGSFFLQNSFHSGTSEIVATDSSQNPDYSLTDKSTNDEFEKEGEMSLAYEHIFNKNEDHTLSFEAAYSAFNEREDLKFSQDYSFPADHTENSVNLVEKSGNQQEILLDYALPFGEDGEFESGYEGEFVLEDIRYTGEASTSRFLSNRQVHALYALIGMPLGDFTFKLGLRAEQTYISSHLKIPVDSLIPNRYFKLFPTLHLGYAMNDNNELSLSYSKRINRPDADELNPYPEYSDPRNAEAGNPDLRPEQIHSLELGYQLHHHAGELTGTLYYRYRYDAFTTIYSNIGDSVVLRTIANLNTQDALGLELVVSGNILENWKLDLTGNLFHTTIDATDLGYSSNKSTLSGNIKAYSLVSLRERTFFQVNAFYYFPTITPQGKRDPYFYMNAGIKQQLFRNRASLTLTASDIFHTYRIRNVITSDELDRITTRLRKLPVIYLGFIWRFKNYREPQKLEYEGEGLVN